MKRLKDITSQYYATTAARGHTPDQAHYEFIAKGLLQRFSAWLPPKGDGYYIDLACGCGEFLYMMQGLGYQHLAGVDLCKEEIEHARRFVRADLHFQDAIEYLRSLPAGSAEMVSALNFLEHVDRDTLVELLSEINRVLRPGGTLIAMVPNAASPFSSISRHWDITHEWAFSQNNFHQLAALTGFSPEIEFRECGPVAHGLKSGIRYVAWQGIRALIGSYLLVEAGTTKGGIYTMDMFVRMRRPK
jgi:SAM-dependent methyltransferase